MDFFVIQRQRCEFCTQKERGKPLFFILYCILFITSYNNLHYKTKRKPKFPFILCGRLRIRTADPLLVGQML